MCQLVIKKNAVDRTLSCIAVFQGHQMKVVTEVQGEIAGMYMFYQMNLNIMNLNIMNHNIIGLSSLYQYGGCFKSNPLADVVYNPQSTTIGTFGIRDLTFNSTLSGCSFVDLSSSTVTPQNIDSSHLTLGKETKGNGDSHMTATYTAAGMEQDFTTKTAWMFVKGSYETATVNFELETQVDLLKWVTENVYLETGTSAASSSIKAYLTGWSGASYTCNTLQISDTGHSDNVYNSSIVVGGNKQVKLEFSASQTTDLNTTATCTRDAPESDLTSPIYLDFIGSPVGVLAHGNRSIKPNLVSDVTLEDRSVSKLSPQTLTCSIAELISTPVAVTWHIEGTGLTSSADTTFKDETVSGTEQTSTLTLSASKLKSLGETSQVTCRIGSGQGALDKVMSLTTFSITTSCFDTAALKGSSPTLTCTVAGLSQALDSASWDGLAAAELGAFSGGSQEVYLKLINVTSDRSYVGSITSGGIIRALQVSLDVFAHGV
eukprot:sb/3464194/